MKTIVVVLIVISMIGLLIGLWSLMNGYQELDQTYTVNETTESYQIEEEEIWMMDDDAKVVAKSTLGISIEMNASIARFIMLSRDAIMVIGMLILLALDLLAHLKIRSYYQERNFIFEV
jgi:uncharacterized membrane protein YkgB